MGGVRMAVRELLQVTGMWFGLGEPDTGDRPASPAAGAGYLTMQTLAAVMLAALVAVGRSALVDRAMPAGFPAPYLIVVIPLAIAVARHPAAAPVPLAAALPAGALAALAARFVLDGPLTGFWWWFTTFAVGALVAGAVFGALANRRPATRQR